VYVRRSCIPVAHRGEALQPFISEIQTLAKEKRDPLLEDESDDVTQKGRGK